MKKSILGIAAAIGAVTMFTAGANAATLDDVKKRGHLVCGVSTGLPGFGAPDQSGKWSGLDVDVCRGIAAAVLGSATKVKFTPLRMSIPGR